MVIADSAPFSLRSKRSRFGDRIVSETIRYDAPWRPRRADDLGSFGSIADGTLVRPDSGDTSAIYFIDQGQRRHITNMTTVYGLRAMGHGDVVTVLTADLMQVPPGPDMSSPSDLLTKIINVASGGGGGGGGSPKPPALPTGVTGPLATVAGIDITPTKLAIGLVAVGTVIYFARRKRR